MQASAALPSLVFSSVRCCSSASWCQPAPPALDMEVAERISDHSLAAISSTVGHVRKSCNIRVVCSYLVEQRRETLHADEFESQSWRD
jgi:hypothetical protein